MVATAFEGLICIIMMLPLAVPVVMLGALVGYFIVSLGPRRPGDLGKVALVLFALLPTMVGAEHLTTPEPLLFTCETSVVIDAPPEEVWRHVVSFSDLDPPNDWLFRSGVAYPIRARIEGTGVGAVRHCEFSTGAFVEPIEVWDEPRLLRFAVTSNPAPMKEWNPLFEIHPPHLDGFLVSKQGQFQLTRCPVSKTLLKEAPCISTVSGRPRTGGSGRTRSSIAFTTASSGTSRRSRSRKRPEAVRPVKARRTCRIRASEGWPTRPASLPGAEW